jgi:hypothetical protein
MSLRYRGFENVLVAIDEARWLPVALSGYSDFMMDYSLCGA